MKKFLLPLLTILILTTTGGTFIYKRQAQITATRQDPPAADMEAGGTQNSIPAANSTTASQIITPAAGTETGVTHPASSREQIEQEYISRLQALASSAAIEFEIAKKTNPDADIGPLADRYYRAGEALEAESDLQFYQLLAEFESELKAGSYPLDAAIETKEAYETRKSARP